MNKYLLLFTISPVQSFISQSRKTVDLYASSQILSKIINEAISTLKTEIPNSVIIFPTRINDLESSPNRFLAKVETDNAYQIGIKLEQKAQSTFSKIASDAYDFIKKNQTPMPEDYSKQLLTFLITNWCFQKYIDDDYKKTYLALEQELGALKNIREFQQLVEKGVKCSLCGERNYIESKNFRNIESVDENEELCGVCYTKRIHKHKSFPSTATITLMSILHSSFFNTEFDEYKKKFKDSDEFQEKAKSTNRKNALMKFEEQLLYEENLNKDYFIKHRYEPLLSNLPEIKESLQKLYRAIKKAKMKLPKYYALLMFDGDSMGKWLSGTNLKEKSDLESFHIELSKRLSEFASSSWKYLDKPRGNAVYAGGDDFMGLVNLDYFTETLKCLREKFDEMVNIPLEEYRKKDVNITFSAGVVIAYYKTPFSEVLKAAREAEKKAKTFDFEKNKLAICLQKHSGEVENSILKWSFNNRISSLSIIEYITLQLKKDLFSNTFIFNLYKEFQPLLSENEEIDSKLVRAEIKRLVKKSFIKINNYSDYLISINIIENELDESKTVNHFKNEHISQSSNYGFLALKINNIWSLRVYYNEREFYLTQLNNEKLISELEMPPEKRNREKIIHLTSIHVMINLVIDLYNSTKNFDNFLNALSLCDFLKRNTNL